MELLNSNVDRNISLNMELDFQTNAGWQENLVQFEEEVLSDIINPTVNYETVRYIHEPYPSSGITQTDIWFYFYFLNGTGYTNSLDYSLVDITPQENEKMLKQSTKSFFRLEFYKTPGVVSGNTLSCEPPTRKNRRLVFAKNLSLPLGEKYYDTNLNGYIHIPVFMGSNYRNKENMYFFWFQDESSLKETNLSGTTTLDKYTFNNTGTTKTVSFNNEFNNNILLTIPSGTTIVSGWTGQTFTIDNTSVTYDRNYYHGSNTFFMTAKFYNAKDGTIIDFTNRNVSSEITEENDMYYQVDIDKFEYSYIIKTYTGVTGNRSGIISNPIKFYQKKS